MQDTLPERVAQRTYEAFKRSDLDATYANYDSVFTYERFGDPAGSHQLRRDDYLRQVKADTAVVHIIKGLRIVLVRTECLALSSIRSGGSGSRMAESSRDGAGPELMGGTVARVANKKRIGRDQSVASALG